MESDLTNLALQAEANSNVGYPSVVPFAEEFVEKIRNSGKSIDSFSFLMKALYLNTKVPHEFIAIVTHYLKPDSFKIFIEDYHREKIQENDWRAIPVARMVIDAYNEPWEDYECFYPGNEN